MKLLEFKGIKNNLTDSALAPDSLPPVYCIHLEDTDEWCWYDDYIVDNCEMFWNGYMTAKLGYYTSDIDIFYYFSPEDKVPEVGEQWELDGLVFERVK